MSDGWLKLSFDSPKLDALREMLARKSARLTEVLSVKVAALTFMLQSKIVAKLSGEILKRKTGTLAGSVTAVTRTDGSTILGSVEAGNGPSHVYAMAHAVGVSRPYEIAATIAKALTFQLSVKEKATTVFAKRVIHPPIPATNFMWNTLDEKRDEIIQELGRAVADIFKEK
jgi:hypothetical protein